MLGHVLFNETPPSCPMRVFAKMAGSFPFLAAWHSLISSVDRDQTPIWDGR